MIDQAPAPPPLDAILRDTQAIGFRMSSEPKTGALLRTLAASKPAGRILELGTGTGVGASWLLDGMDARSTLDTVENDPAAGAVARRHLGADPRVRFHTADAADFLTRPHRGGFDLIYADTWAGKFTHLDEALSRLNVGGLYVIDDLLPQENWPEGHHEKVARLVDDLLARRQFAAVTLDWASGLMLLVRTAPAAGGPGGATSRPMSFTIRPAVPGDAEALTAIAFSAKAHWGYPPEWIEQWRDELTITAAYLRQHQAFVAVDPGAGPIGMCVLEVKGGQASIENVWIAPAQHRRGIGRELVTRALEAAAGAGVATVDVVSDPFAEAFYLRLGARLRGTVPAPMPGAPARELPVLSFEIPQMDYDLGFPAG